MCSTHKAAPTAPARMAACSSGHSPALPRAHRGSMKHVIAFLLLSLVAAGPSYAQAKVQGLFDVELRRAALTQPALTNVRAACLAVPRDPAWISLKPIDGLKATEGYGTDGAANDYAWAVMVMTGRALAGDLASEASLR